MVAPSLLMLSVFCAWETPADVSASAPSASAILLFLMMPLLGWLVRDRYEHSRCYGEGLRNQMGAHTLVRVNRPAAVDKRPVSARREKPRAACAASTRLPAGGEGRAQQRARSSPFPSPG